MATRPDSHPRIPYSCPEFDAAIARIEEARTINDDLRGRMEEWKDYSEELEEESQDLENKIEEKDAEIERLKADEKEYQKTIHSLEKQLAELQSIY